MGRRRAIRYNNDIELVKSTLIFSGTKNPGLSKAGQCKIWYDTANDLLKVSQNGGAYAIAANLGGVVAGTSSASKPAVLGTHKNLDTLDLTAGAVAAAIALRLGASGTEGLEVRVVDEVITLTNAVSTALTNTVPAGASIISVQANLDSLIVGDASGDDLLAKVGIGISSGKAKYGVSADLVKNTKIDTINPALPVLAGAETISAYAMKTDGTTACTEKFVAGGLVRVRIVYLALNSLDDHA